MFIIISRSNMFCRHITNLSFYICNIRAERGLGEGREGRNKGEEGV